MYVCVCSAAVRKWTPISTKETEEVLPRGSDAPLVFLTPQQRTDADPQRVTWDLGIEEDAPYVFHQGTSANALLDRGVHGPAGGEHRVDE